MRHDPLKAIRKISNLERAWRVIQQNGRTSKSDEVRLDLETFGEDAPSNLRKLQRALGRGTFEFGKAKGIPIKKLDAQGRPTGKIRPLVLASVESRIVQRAVLNVLVGIEDLQPYFLTPYSFGGIRSVRRHGDQSRKESASAVPAAIKAVLNEIGSGSTFVITADIRAFFTRISKDHVATIVARAVNHPEFEKFFRKAISVELSNLALLKEKAVDFPIEDMGVAQGNSLSPLLGNIVLAEFDRAMNEGDCRCIRYIDDFIILAPSKKAAAARFTRAVKLLDNLGMELSVEKSSRGPQELKHGFDFLGINVCPGLIRPSQKARDKFTASVASLVRDTQQAMITLKNGQTLKREQALLGTLKRLDGMIDGWGKHYWFCNDGQVFANIDKQLNEQITSLLGCYRSVRESLPIERRTGLFGMTELATLDRDPFIYPTQAC